MKWHYILYLIYRGNRAFLPESTIEYFIWCRVHCKKPHFVSDNGTFHFSSADDMAEFVIKWVDPEHFGIRIVKNDGPVPTLPPPGAKRKRR